MEVLTHHYIVQRKYTQHNSSLAIEPRGSCMFVIGEQTTPLFFLFDLMTRLKQLYKLWTNYYRTVQIEQHGLFLNNSVHHIQLEHCLATLYIMETAYERIYLKV